MGLEKVDERRNILVGVDLDKESKQLLGWALVKVADSGDHVVALHVSTNSEEAPKERLLLDDYVDFFSRLCHIKKVKLNGKIVTGKSIRKTLVKEAKQCDADVVIVGITRIGSIGSWASTSKYCVKHLPSTTQILTLHNGKIVFKRRSTDHDSQGLSGDPKWNQQKQEKSSKNEFEFHDSEVSISEADSLSPKMTITGQSSSETESSSDSSVEALENKLPIVSNTQLCDKRAPLRSVSLCTVESDSELKPGWPLLRRVSLPTQRAMHMQMNSSHKMSVVQWVMNLPDRCSPDSPISSSTDACSANSDSPQARENNRRQRSHSALSELLAEEDGFTFESISSEFTWFSYETLKKATSQFSSENLIAKGGSSQVYKGVLVDGKRVAVKVVKSSKQARKDFSAEVNIMSCLRHKNITPLLGVCIANTELISVYEFMPKGSLEQNLHGKKENESLSWEARYRIAVGIAEALVYLHNECSSSVIHRDVKSSNILLSDHFDPQLSDFGLAIWAPPGTSSGVEEDVAAENSREEEVVGTFGYMAPEYVMYGKVTHKVDVYSFGVVLLELLSGRRPILHSSHAQESLVIWARRKLESGKVESLVDPMMEEGRWDEGQMQKMVVAANLCLTMEARHRPNMAQVLRILKGEESGETWVKNNIHVSEQDQDMEEINKSSATIIDIIKEDHEISNIKSDDDCTDCNSVVTNTIEPCTRLSLADLFKESV